MVSTWKVRQIEAINEDALENVVVTVCFAIDGNENGLKGYVEGDVKLLPPDADHFTKLADATEEQVIGWTKAALGDNGVAQVESRLQAQIDAQKAAQPKVVPLPWAPVEEKSEEAA
jgi:hypothetical protein